MGGASPRTPGLRTGAAVAFDGTERRIWLWGGRPNLPSVNEPGGTFASYGDLWMLNLSAVGGPVWESIPTSSADGGAPAPAQDATLVVDAPMRRLVLFGGLSTCSGGSRQCPDGGTSSATYLDQVWTFSLDSRTWQRISPAQDTGGARLGEWPAPRSRHAAVYDALKQRLVVYGGGGEGGLPLGDVWTMSLHPALDGAPNPNRWQRHPMQGRPAPSARIPSYAFDPFKRHLVVMGGLHAVDGGLVDAKDVWALDVSEAPRWEKVPGDTPAPLWRDVPSDFPLGVGEYDVRNRSFVFLVHPKGQPKRMLLHVDAESPAGDGKYCTLNTAPLDDVRQDAPLLYDPSDFAVFVASGTSLQVASSAAVKRLSLACQSRLLSRIAGKFECGL